MITPRSCKSFRPLLATDRPSEAEQIVRVDLALDPLEPRVVGAVVGVLPTDELGIDVVLVGETRDVRAQARVESAEPAQRLALADRAPPLPRGDLLQRETLPAMDESRGCRRNPVDPPPVGIEEDRAGGAGGLARLDRREEDRDAGLREAPTYVVGLRGESAPPARAGEVVRRLDERALFDGESGRLAGREQRGKQ